MTKTYFIPEFLPDFPRNNWGVVEALAAFLLDNVGSIWGKWTGTLSKQAQITLFGHYFGRGRFVIVGAGETFTYKPSVAERKAGAVEIERRWHQPWGARSTFWN